VPCCRGAPWSVVPRWRKIAGQLGRANIVQTVKDPRHKGTGIPGVAGTRPGETLDPKAFDVKHPNEDLQISSDGCRDDITTAGAAVSVVSPRDRTSF
jgi:hypothetical protein